METILNGINLYPHQISFNHNKKNQFYSSCGLIFSFISYIIIGYLVFYFSYDLIQLKNPKISIKQVQLNENLKFNLDSILKEINFSMFLCFNVENSNFNVSQLFDESITLEIEKRSSSKSEYFIQKNFKISGLYNNTKRPLLKEGILYNYSIGFDMNLENFLEESVLIKKGTKKDLTFRNLSISINSDILLFSYFFFPPQNIAQYYIDSGKSSLIFSDNFIDSDDSKFRKKFDRDYVLSKKQSINIFYRVIEFENDRDNLFTNFTRDYIPQIDFYYVNNESYQDFYNNFNCQFLIIKFRPIMEIHRRVYKKIWDVLSELGGVFNLILIVGRILVYNFNKKKFDISLLNKLFTYDDINQEIKKDDENKNRNNYKRRMNLTKNSHFFYENIFDVQKKGIFSKINIDKSKKFQDKLFNFIEMKDLKNAKSSVEILQNEHFINGEILFKSDSIKNGNISSSRINALELNETDLIKDVNLDEINKKTKRYKQKENIQIRNNNHIEEINQKNSQEVNKFYLDIEIKDDNIKKRIDEYLKINRQQKLMRYTYKDFFLSIICFGNCINKKLLSNEELYDKILNKINFYYEITNLMRLYENLEKMKFILFNKNQIKCFDYMIYDINWWKDDKKEEDILMEINKYFSINDSNFIQKYFNESIKILIRDDIKKLLNIT